MIDERQEEQASLYVLGALTADEAATFEAALRRDPELQQFVATLRDATGALAGTVPPVTPPPALKQRILDEIDRREKIVPLTPSVAPARRPVAWLPWAIAACFAIVCWFSYRGENELKGHYRDLAEVYQRSKETNTSLTSALDELKQEYDVANLRIAMMESKLADSPNAAAVALWNEKDQTGVLVVKNLKQLPADKDYELWVFDGPTPVAAGLLQVDGQGNVRIPFKAHARIQNTGNFAITEEPKGGGEAPRGNVVLAGASL